MSNFHPHEVVDRGNEKQLQLGENCYPVWKQCLKQLHHFSFHVLFEICDEEDAVSREPWKCISMRCAFELHFKTGPDDSVNN